MIFIDQEALAFVACVARSLANQPDPELGLSELVDQIKQYFGIEAASIFALDEARNELVLKYATGTVSGQVIGMRLPVGLGVVGWVVKFNDPLIVPAPNLDPRFFSGVDQQTSFATQSILCAPIVRDDQKLGAIELINKTNGDFTDDDVNLLRELARTIADTYERL